ncbi:hypothetical protein SNE40_021646 [Patella caerulea]|uniref:C-type lectin n=1 Tax=Patella caerulea TaxID=87958 RepID=A0AAN8GBH9_PATCE
MSLLKLIWVSLYTAAASINCPNNVFQLITTLTDTLVDNAIGMHTGLTVKRCGEKCLETPTCASFSYLLKDGYECHLFGHHAWYGWNNHTVYNELVTYWLLAELCPSDYKYNTTYNVCYKAYFGSADERDFLDAMARCQQDGGYLYVGNTAEKFQIIQGLDSSSYNNVYIGGTRLGQEWTWMDGSAINNMVWHPGEPSNLNEKCAAIIYGSQNAALDISCTAKRKFICEIPIRK